MNLLHVEFILYVDNQHKSCAFYSQVLDLIPVLDVEGMTEFDLPGGSKLGLMPCKGIARYICPLMPDPSIAKGIPRCELYIVCDDPEKMLENARKSGTLIIDEVKPRNWGHKAGYFADPDGHIIAVAKPL